MEKVMTEFWDTETQVFVAIALGRLFWRFIQWYWSFWIFFTAR